MESIEIRDGFENMDFDSVTALLSKAFWSPGIGIDEVKKGAANSALVVGAFIDGMGQVGYARVVSDKTRFAYLTDVIVDERFRKHGLGKMMIRHILSHQELVDVYQWLLITRDAHAFYREFGFQPVSRPLDWMEIREPRPQR